MKPSQARAFFDGLIYRIVVKNAALCLPAFAASDAAADRLCTDMDKFRFHTGSLQRAGSLSQRSVGTALRMGAAV